MAGFLKHVKQSWLALAAVAAASSGSWFLHTSYNRHRAPTQLAADTNPSQTEHGGNINESMLEAACTLAPEDCQSHPHCPSSAAPFQRQKHRVKPVPSDNAVVKAVISSRRKILRVMLEQGVPGAVVAVARDGRLVWSEGIGFSDVENRVACGPETVMRIASISKSLAAVGCLQLWEKGLVDLDAPIQRYVPEFPKKTFEGKAVDITTRQLLTHLAGIRHYTRKEDLDASKDEAQTKLESEEFHLKTHFKTLEETFKLFENDQLLSRPGERFNYTTHGWTLVSAVMERVSGEPFLEYMKRQVFDPLGMRSTQAEFHEPLVYHRAKHYVKNDKGSLCNTPYVDNSCKWAGGGFLSNAEDLVRFGNALLVSLQSSTLPKSSPNQIIQTNSPTYSRRLEARVQDIAKIEFVNIANEDVKTPKPLLDPSTVALMWSPHVKNGVSERDAAIKYGLGWYVIEEQCDTLGGKMQPLSVGHPGGAVGGTSAFIILPTGAPQSQRPMRSNRQMVIQSLSLSGQSCGCALEGDGLAAATGAATGTACSGIVVALIFNLQDMKGVYKLGNEVAEAFL